MPWLVWLAACGGPETQIRELYPVLSVAPGALDLGEVGPPLTGVGEIYLTNSGSAALEVTATLEGGAGTFALGETAFDIAPGEDAVLAVSFTPETFKAYEARIVLESNDEERPRVVVPLTGEGVDLPFPDIEIRPGRTVEALDVPIGEEALLFFEVVNTGDAPLALGEVTLDGPPVFATALDPSGYVIEAGGSAAMIVGYTPTQDLGDSATVTIPSNDPDEPALTVLLLGNGGGDFEYPVAAIDCPSTVLLTGPEWVTLDGRDSYDPAGAEPLTYQWIVSRRPEASDPDVPLDPDDTPEVDLYVDVAGTWEVALQVKNALGTPSIPAACVFEAIPEDDLHVELSWDTTAADLDLHLLQGGATWFETPGDCNYCNTNPDWGTSSADDDPRLDIDDRGGLGPENINILHPEDGTYDVKVHYFRENGDGPVVATVRVWLAGAEVFVGSQVLTYNQVWDVGTIDWAAPSGDWYPSAEPVWSSGSVRTCF